MAPRPTGATAGPMRSPMPSWRPGRIIPSCASSSGLAKAIAPRRKTSSMTDIRARATDRCGALRLRENLLAVDAGGKPDGRAALAPGRPADILLQHRLRLLLSPGSPEPQHDQARDAGGTLCRRLRLLDPPRWLF